MKSEKRFLKKFNEKTYVYNQPLIYEGIDLSIRFTIQRNEDGWFSSQFDVSGETVEEVVDEAFQVMTDQAKN